MRIAVKRAVAAYCALLWLCAVGGFSAMAQTEPVSSKPIVPEIPLVVQAPVLVADAPKVLMAPARLRAQMPLVQWRRRESLNHLYQFDETALVGRTPLILLPGRAEEFQQNSWWKKFRRMTRDNKPFNARYKLYAFIYNSSDELAVQAADFTREANAYFSDFPVQGRAMTLICYSLGGMITSEAMRDPSLLARVDRVFAIAVPFHGSPMFDPEWFTKYLRPGNHSPIRRFWDRSAYRLYLFGKSNLKDGLRWQNFDGSKPLYGKPEVYGHMLVGAAEPYHPHPVTDAFKRKLIVYASYLENPYTNPEKYKKKGVTQIIKMPLYLPRAVVGSLLPIYGVSVHSIFSYMNIQLANLPTYDPENPLGKNERLYRYNDGVFPLTSMLFLPARARPYRENFEDMLPLMDIRSARVFVGIDHVEIGEYARTRRRLITSDALDPKAGARTPHQWLILDLMRPALFPEQKMSLTSHLTAGKGPSKRD
ncbi:MAG: hypothetical protein IPK79_03445 [Vampirovibrionales bacterium]|nr:hypothetical protein [Vampirovibrionales bacterium]